jgi:hypothetical protein
VVDLNGNDYDEKKEEKKIIKDVIKIIKKD